MLLFYVLLLQVIIKQQMGIPTNILEKNVLDVELVKNLLIWVQHIFSRGCSG
jgi:hypothetical protein